MAVVFRLTSCHCCVRVFSQEVCDVSNAQIFSADSKHSFVFPLLERCPGSYDNNVPCFFVAPQMLRGVCWLEVVIAVMRTKWLDVLCVSRQMSNVTTLRQEVRMVSNMAMCEFTALLWVKVNLKEFLGQERSSAAQSESDTVLRLFFKILMLKTGYWKTQNADDRYGYGCTVWV